MHSTGLQKMTGRCCLRKLAFSEVPVRGREVLLHGPFVAVRKHQGKTACAQTMGLHVVTLRIILCS